MTAVPPESLVTEGVRSLEVRWIFPGQLETAVARWFGRFPAWTESREDAYLLDPQLRGLSVKVRGGGALKVKAYRGSARILEVPGRARERMESWQKWSFPFSRPADKSWHAPKSWASSRGARWNSPRSTRAASTGGPWASRRPAPQRSTGRLGG
jgi:hypothetical protein